MLGLERIINFIKTLDRSNCIRFIGAILGGIFLILTLAFYSYHRNIKFLRQKLLLVNKQREEVRELLGRNQKLLEQQTRVDEILTQNKGFKIKEYFISLVQSLGLAELVSKEPDTAIPQELFSGYAEIKLDVSFAAMTMQQLVDLLYKIEQNERVYTKDLKITKNQKTPTIDVSLVIATLETTA